MNDDIVDIVADEEEHVTSYSSLVIAESFMCTINSISSCACTINSTSSHIASKFSAETHKKALNITKYLARNWTNATSFRLWTKR